MKWDKIKNFLIVLLLVVDIFLGVTLLLQYRNINYVSSGNLQRLSQLVSDNVEIPPGILPAKKQQGIIYGGSYPDDYFETVAHLLSGGAEASSYVTPNGMSIVTGSGSTDTYEFTYPFGFKYVYRSSDPSGIFEIDPGYISELPEVDFVRALQIKNTVKKFLYADGALNGPDVPVGLRIRLEFGGVRYDAPRELYITTVAQYVGGQPVYGCEAVVAVKNSKVVYVSGNLILCNLDESRNRKLRDQVNLMLLESHDLGGSGAVAETLPVADGETENGKPPQQKTAADPEPPHRNEISPAADERYVLTSAESCLCITWYANRAKFYLLPGWKFTYNDSVVRVRNSLNGDIYTK